jgi:predicted TIM-barrel fold metal-dependent hydrolase
MATLPPSHGSPNRRGFLQVVAGAAALAPTMSTHGLAAVPANSLIDAHSHIWTREVTRFPLKKGTKLTDLDPPSFSVDALLKLTAANRVGRVVLIQHHLFHGYDNSYLVHAAAKHPKVFRVVGMVNDLGPNPAREMKDLLRSHVTGFRITSWIRKKAWLKGAGMESMWRCAADTGQAICCLMDPPDLPSLDAMCERHPKTPVVIDHFARIGVDGTIRDQDIEKLCKLARHARTHVKLSAYYALGAKQSPYLDLLPMIRKVIDAFGPDRCMWASDSPYQLEDGHSYTASLQLIQKHCPFLSDGDRDKILHGTAQRVYFSQ